MRAVIDTNVLLSGQFWRGAPYNLLVRVRDGALTLILSPEILAEIATVLSRPKFQKMLDGVGRSRTQILAELHQLADIIDPPPLATRLCRDPDDDKILALARAAQADIIISGDKDLLAMGTFNTIRILTPADALQC